MAEAAGISISAENFDKALRGGLDADGRPVLPEAGDLQMFVKPGAMESGKAGVIFTFSVQLPNGTMARAQTVTSAAIFETAGMIVKGWKEGGHI